MNERQGHHGHPSRRSVTIQKPPDIYKPISVKRRLIWEIRISGIVRDSPGFIRDSRKTLGIRNRISTHLPPWLTAEFWLAVWKTASYSASLHF
eukprot:1336099-Amorphochlora_amoeboformis.AAC.1